MPEQRTTYEEAKCCPKCGKPGVVRKSTPASGHGLMRGTRVEHIYCVTELCPWYNTCWMVQVNPDGSIPPPQDHSRSPKMYEGFEGHDQIARDIVKALEAQAEMDRHGGEIRNPNSGR